MTPEKHWEWQQLIADQQARIDQAIADATVAVMSARDEQQGRAWRTQWQYQIHWLRVQKKQLIEQYDRARLK